MGKRSFWYSATAEAYVARPGYVPRHALVRDEWDELAQELAAWGKGGESS